MSMTAYWLIGAIILVSLLILFIFRLRMVCAFFTAFLLIVFLRSGVFVVYEGSQVVITQFGDIIGKPYTQAGLYLKVPVIWKTNFVEKRVIAEEEEQPGVATKDGYFITLKVVFLWRITNAADYISSVDSLDDAKVLLRNIVSGEVRQAVSRHDLLDTIRSIAPVGETTGENTDTLLGVQNVKAFESSEMIGKQNEVVDGRKSLLKEAKKTANKYIEHYGIKVLRVYITDVQYSPEVQKLIHQRMVLERLREAARLRSIGRSEANRIEGQTEKHYQSIVAPARRKALLIKGEAEAYSTKVMAEAFGKDRRFYNYWRTLETYKNNLSKNSNGMIISTELPYLNFMSSPARWIARPNASQDTLDREAFPIPEERKLLGKLLKPKSRDVKASANKIEGG
jgi:modulator of FtsH protease HflC